MSRNLCETKYVTPIHRNRSSMKKYGLSECISICTLIFILVKPSFAQDEAAGSISIGETKVIPSISIYVDGNNNSNLEENDPVSSTGLVVSPEVDWIADRRLLELRASYSGEYKNASESVLNYTDHSLSISAAALLSKRKKLDGRIFFTQGHQLFGTGFTDPQNGLASRQTVVRDLGSVLRYRYGASGAKGNLVVGLNLSNREFARDDGLATGRDYFRYQTNAIMSFRISPDSRFLVEGRYADFNYDNDIFDRGDTSFLVGFSFAPTGKSGGSAKLGTTRNQFDNDTFSDSSFAIAELDLFYAFRPYSRISFGIDRRFDSDNTSELIANEAKAVREVASVKWRHEWNSQISSTASFGVDNVVRDCPANSSDTRTGGLEFTYRARRWLSFGFGVDRLVRDAAVCPEEPDSSSTSPIVRNTYNLSMSMTL